MWGGEGTCAGGAVWGGVGGGAAVVHLGVAAVVGGGLAIHGVGLWVGVGAG